MTTAAIIVAAGRAVEDRSAAIRIPAYSPSEKAKRFEFRCPDPTCNPYLAFSLMLAAGMRGVEEGYELPEEADANLFEIGDDVLGSGQHHPVGPVEVGRIGDPDHGRFLHQPQS